MSKMIRWGVLGCANIAEEKFIPGLLKAENGVLYAVSSRGAGDHGTGEKLERFRKKFKPEKAYASYEEMLDDPNVDAVYNPLPNGLHCEWTLKAAEKGKHILCEKPLGATVDEVKKIREGCEKHGVLFMEAFAYREAPILRRVKSILDSGRLGDVWMIESHFAIDLNDRSNVRFDPKLAGGATYDLGCYNINVIRTLFGAEPDRILASGRVSETGVDLESAIVMDFGDRRGISSCAFGGFDDPWYRVSGEKGILTVPGYFNSIDTDTIYLHTAGGKEEIKVENPDNYMLEAEQFGRAINGEEKPLISFEDSLANAAVIDEALRQIFAQHQAKR